MYLVKALLALAIACSLSAPASAAADRVGVSGGVIEAATAAGSEVRIFKGIPFAAPRTDGEWFAKQGIVVVAPNYRLGLFGFLAHPQLSTESGGRGSGNYGMLDQVAALRWVQDNIAAFGGNPRSGHWF